MFKSCANVALENNIFSVNNSLLRQFDIPKYLSEVEMRHSVSKIQVSQMKFIFTDHALRNTGNLHIIVKKTTTNPTNKKRKAGKYTYLYECLEYDVLQFSLYTVD